MIAYYNENDSKAAAWLRELINRDLIAPGVVDERSIEDVHPNDLQEFTQCHFFAGIGVWSYALRLADWPDSRPVWTGSCPCPPFSTAGKGQQCPDCGSKRNLCHPCKTGHFICLDCGCDRFADGRHLWPEFSRLIKKCRPTVVFGEQVASKDGRYWLDAVSADLQNTSYGFAGADLCAAGVGAPHIRQRLWFVAERLADADNPGSQRRVQRGNGQDQLATRPTSVDGGLANTDGSDAGAERQQRGREQRGREQRYIQAHCVDGVGLGDSQHDGHHKKEASQTEPSRDRPNSVLLDGNDSLAERQPEPSPTNGFWRDSDWLYCRDGKWRPVEPGTFPLVNGAAARVGRLRGYGNAINAQVARIFIESYVEAR